MFAWQDWFQESNPRKGKGLFPSPPAYPDLPLALGQRPGRICELSLVLGKCLGAAGDLVSSAGQRGEASDGQGIAGVVLSSPD